jgi:hypothetical protein
MAVQELKLAAGTAGHTLRGASLGSHLLIAIGRFRF